MLLIFFSHPPPSLLHVVCVNQERMNVKRIVSHIMANRRKWLRIIPGNIKEAEKQAEIYVGRFTTVNNLLFCVHTLCMSYVIKTFPLVRSSVRCKQLLCFVHGQDQKSEQKHTTKKFV